MKQQFRCKDVLMIMNPFTPNYVENPLYLAVGSQEINDVQYLLEGAISAPARTQAFIGARGIGKMCPVKFDEYLTAQFGSDDMQIPSETNGWSHKTELVDTKISFNQLKQVRRVLR